jgi:hypothetical protein
MNRKASRVQEYEDTTFSLTCLKEGGIGAGIGARQMTRGDNGADTGRPPS